MAHTALSWMPGTAAVELTPPCAACQALRSICAPVRTAAVGGLLVHRSVWRALQSCCVFVHKHGQSLLSNMCTVDRHEVVIYWTPQQCRDKVLAGPLTRYGNRLPKMAPPSCTATLILLVTKQLVEVPW
jgi:hypothetical protein